ncbi:S26 family signal peptidase [Actinokineospora xionganensis]|uniref:S26 family signal peptidase n=1 Tax=Actinokineospora xionganensis TaxID=2684470 RepID=A0ABR7L6S8_9PSEU|nr:S26 family signal peptidase [Actinokineospora xionganensis]MBC6448344.1 S26 family signal peptidase [Actinokineospora xionganensis]
MPVRRVTVRGASMAPALDGGDVVLATHGTPRPGDVVLVTWPSRPGQLSVKRAIRPAGYLWHVEGDFAEASFDSRYFGPAKVHAVVRWRLWPRPGRIQPRRSA